MSIPWSKSMQKCWNLIERYRFKMRDLLRHFIVTTASLAARRFPASLSRSIYRVPALANLIREGLNWALEPGFEEVTVAGGDLYGVRLRLNLREEKDYWLGTYEPDVMRTCRDLVVPGMIAYDIGAHIGYISLFLAHRVGEGGQVFAFEALLGNVTRLKEHIDLNAVSHRVHVIHAAVVRENQPVRFFSGPSNATGRALGSAGRKSVFLGDEGLVAGVAIDDFVFQQGHPAPQFIKMDIEGGEILALPGMIRTLQEKKPVLLLELHSEQAIQFTWEILTRVGYNLCTLKKGYPRVVSVEQLGQKAYLVAIAGGES